MSKGEKVGEEPKKRKIYCCSSGQGSNILQCLCRSWVETSQLPPNESSSCFYICRLFALTLFSVSCFPTSRSLVFTICPATLFYRVLYLCCSFQLLKIIFYSCYAIPFHQSLIQLLGICQNWNWCHLFPS